MCQYLTSIITMIWVSCTTSTNKVSIYVTFFYLMRTPCVKHFSQFNTLALDAIAFTAKKITLCVHIFFFVVDALHPSQ